MSDPAVSVAYKCTIDGFIPLGIWTKIEGLGFEYDVHEFREGGVNGYTHKVLGPCKYTNLKLSRPVDSTSELLMLWLQSNMIKVIPQTLSITAMTMAGDEITTWNLAGVVPYKWTGPSLDIMSNNVATETLEVVYQEIIGLGALGGMLAGAMSLSANVSVGFWGHAMVMDAVGSAASAVGQALGLVKGTKAKLVCVGKNMPDGPHEIECSFNPTDYTLTQSVAVPSATTPSKEGGQQQYGGTGAMKFTTNLFFDAFSEAKGDVTPKITTLLTWMKPTKASGSDGRHCPPMVQFKWGGNPQLDKLIGFLTDATVKYTLFRMDGTPVRAEVAITITAQSDPATGTNPTSHAVNSRRVHQVIDGDTLQSVAYRELGKPTYWRSIAELNNIDDPMRLPAGTVLLIPSVADATRGN